MKKNIRARLPELTFGRVVGGAAVLVLLSAGTAYAANEWTGENIVNGSLTTLDYKNDDISSIDIKNGSILNGDLANESVASNKILNGTVAVADLAPNSVNSAKVVNNTLTGDDILDGAISGADVLDGTISGADVTDESLAAADLATDSVQATEIADDSIDSGEIVDFGLTNEDVGVLFAQVNADGTLFASSGGVTSASLGTGTYEVDFGRNISNCGFFATQGEGGVGGAGGAIVGVTDRSGNPEGIFVTTRDPAGALLNTAVQILVVC